MTLQQKIQNQPFFKANNCTDINDVEYALSECKKLLKEYGSKASLCIILSRLSIKKEKIEASK